MCYVWQILLARAEKDYPAQNPPPLRFIRSCSSSLAAPTLHKLEATFHVPVLEVCALSARRLQSLWAMSSSRALLYIRILQSDQGW